MTANRILIEGILRVNGVLLTYMRKDIFRRRMLLVTSCLSKVVQQKKPCKSQIYKALLSVVPRAGVEPARVAPQVFETSASTNSAIWAKRLQIYVGWRSGQYFREKIF